MKRMRVVAALTVIAAGAAVEGAAAPASASTGPTLSIDSRYERHTIPAEIYGFNYASPDLAKELGLTVDRFGGNSTTTYNYQGNLFNNALDYYWENTDAGQSDDSAAYFINQDRTNPVHPRTLLTLPTMGWVADPTKPGACSYPTSKYPDQTDHDPYNSNCGNGVASDGSRLTADPSTAYEQVDATFDRAWVQQLVATYGTALHGGIGYYSLDNEPGLWASTHYDVHPVSETDDELLAKDIPVAQAVKSIDNTAKVVGPADWGFLGALESEEDLDSTNGKPDTDAHGGLTAGQYFLQQMKAASDSTGRRLLDYFDEHYYPQADGVTLAPAGSASTQALRLRQTRTLWDPTYNDESWQNDLGYGPVQFIPRMKSWINQYYPGTKLAISEYNFGGLEAVNGALAEADVLGIFAREGVDLATIWDGPTSKQPGAFAFRMYRNYDGKGGQFGTSYMRSRSSDQGKLAVYAAARSDHRTTIMVVNKTGSALTSQLSIAGFTPKVQTYYRFQYSGSNKSKIVPVSTSGMKITNGKFTATYPANSITLWII